MLESSHPDIIVSPIKFAPILTPAINSVLFDWYNILLHGGCKLFWLAGQFSRTIDRCSQVYLSGAFLRFVTPLISLAGVWLSPSPNRFQAISSGLFKKLSVASISSLPSRECRLRMNGFPVFFTPRFIKLRCGLCWYGQAFSRP